MEERLMEPVKKGEEKSVEGLPYTLETAKQLRYGGIVNADGIIVKAYTKEDMEERFKRCARKAKCTC
jgi:hypothetical protein